MISHHHKCIFVHIPKTAGQSVELMFLEDLGLTWETRAPLLLRYNDDPSLGPPRLAHLRIGEYLDYRYISPSLFQEYFKFAIIRNPFDRAVSFYKYHDSSVSFRYFVREILSRRLWKERFWFVRPQIDFLSNDNGEILVDCIVEFEDLAENLESLREETGVRSPLRHVNRSAILRQSLSRRVIRLGRGLATMDSLQIRSALGEKETCRSIWEYYDSESRKIILDLYGPDFEAWEFTFDGSSADL